MQPVDSYCGLEIAVDWLPRESYDARRKAALDLLTLMARAGGLADTQYHVLDRSWAKETELLLEGMVKLPGQSP